MKKIFTIVGLLFLNSMFLVSCTKSGSDTEEGTDITVKTTGHLCTLGGRDTLHYFFPTTGHTLAGYRPEWARVQDKVNFVPLGNGKMRIEMITPIVNPAGEVFKYLGVFEAGNPSITSFPNHKYQFNLFVNPGPGTEFFIEREKGDVTKFTIESALFRGYYFNTGKWKGHLGSDHVNLVIEPGKRLWFIQ